MNHIFPACEAMASPIRAEMDLCANALCSSSEIALMLRVVVEAVCILPCYSGMRERVNSVLTRGDLTAKEELSGGCRFYLNMSCGPLSVAQRPRLSTFRAPRSARTSAIRDGAR